MLTLLSLAALYATVHGAWRASRAVVSSLRSLPRCNEDMVFI